MDFLYDGNSYKIEFGRDQDLSPNSAVLVRSTSCTIRRDRGGSLVGRSWCHRNDQFSKETGRKLALTRALMSYDRGFRTAAWKAYLGRKGGLK